MSVGIRVPGLTRLDVLELKEAFPEAKVSFEKTGGTDVKQGELATVAVITLSAIGLKMLAAWLLKSRTTDVVEKTIEIVNADGSTRTERIKVNLARSTAPDAKVVDSLSKILDFDMSQLSGK